MATHQSGQTTKNGRDSNPKYLGLKKGHRQIVLAGSILVKQRGAQKKPGQNVKMSRDHTLFAIKNGMVFYYVQKGRTFVKIVELPKNSTLLEVVKN